MPDPETTALLAEVDADFAAGGRPIHPKLIAEFEPWLSDHEPVTLKVDLSAAAGSNEYFDGSVETLAPTEFPGTPTHAWTDRTEPAETFRYRHLGRLADGTHVLFTASNGGGSGWFESVSFVRAAAEPIGRTGCWRVTLETRGTFGIGDRSGREITVVDDAVLVSPRHDEPEAAPQRIEPW